MHLNIVPENLAVVLISWPLWTAEFCALCQKCPDIALLVNKIYRIVLNLLENYTERVQELGGTDAESIFYLGGRGGGGRSGLCWIFSFYVFRIHFAVLYCYLQRVLNYEFIAVVWILACELILCLHVIRPHCRYMTGIYILIGSHKVSPLKTHMVWISALELKIKLNHLLNGVDKWSIECRWQDFVSTIYQEPVVGSN